MLRPHRNSVFFVLLVKLLMVSVNHRHELLETKFYHCLSQGQERRNMVSVLGGGQSTGMVFATLEPGKESARCDLVS